MSTRLVHPASACSTLCLRVGMEARAGGLREGRMRVARAAIWGADGDARASAKKVRSR